MVNPEAYDFLDNLNTIWAIIVGAILATIGGFVATQIEWILEQRRRERNAALLFGEVLSTLAVLMGVADRARGIGDPYGRVTMRMLRTARAEIDIYDRNREALYDLRNADLRARIHMNVLRVAMALEGVFDATREIEDGQIKKKAPGLSETERREFAEALANLNDVRSGAFDFAIETVAKLKATVRDLEPLGGHSFQAIETVVSRQD